MLRPFLLRSLLLLSVLAAWPAVGAQWIAVRIKGQAIPSGEVARFIEDSMLTDPVKIALFSLAGGDSARYEEEKQRWIEKNFDSGLRASAYIAHVQSRAMLDAAWSGGTSFQVPAGTALRLIQEKEAETLKPYAGNDGILGARTRYGEFLLKSRYPHQKNQAAESLYWDWYKAEERRIAERLRIQAAMEWLVTRAAAGMPKAEVSPFDFQPFAEKTRSEIAAAFSPTVRSEEQVQRILAKNPHFQALLRKVETTDPSQLSLSGLMRAVPDALPKLVPVFGQEFQVRVLSWEKRAIQYAQEHPDAEKLRSLARKSLDDFFRGTGDERHLVLARILAVSALFVEGGRATGQAPERFLESSLPPALETFRSSLSDQGKFSASHGNESLESALTGLMAESLGKLSETRPLFRELSDLAVTAVRLETKRYLHSLRMAPKLEFRDSHDPAFFPLAKKSIELQRLRKSLSELHENDLRWAAASDLVIFPSSGDAPVSGDRAWDYCQNNPFRNDLLETTP